jgi:hypothetical protein
MDCNYHPSFPLIINIAEQVSEQETCEYVLVLAEKQSAVAGYPAKHTFLALRWSILEELASIRPRPSNLTRTYDQLGYQLQESFLIMDIICCSFITPCTVHSDYVR